MQIIKYILFGIIVSTAAFGLNWNYRYFEPPVVSSNHYDVLETAEGDLLFFGTGWDPDCYIRVLRTDSLGIVIHESRFTNTEDAILWETDTTASGAIGMVGFIGTMSDSVFFAIYDPASDNIVYWTGLYRYDSYLGVHCIAGTPDSGFVIGLQGDSTTTSGYYWHFVKFCPPDWDIEWESVFHFDVYSGPEEMYVDNAGCINVIDFLPSSYHNSIFMRLSPDGDSILTNRDYFPNYINNVCAAYNEGYMVVGENHMGAWAAKIDSSGDTIWTKDYGVTDLIDGEIYMAIQIPPDKYAMTGRLDLDDDLLYMLIDSSGNLLEYSSYGAPDTVEWGWGICRCRNGDVVMTGRAYFPYETWHAIGIRQEVLDTTSIEESSIKPVSFSITACPNPFNSAVTISLDAPVGEGLAPSRIEIFDINGRMIAEIFANNSVGDGFPVPLANGRGDLALTTRQYIWQPESSVVSGVYLVRAKIGDSEAIKRVVYLK
ncbi:T9SS type A sorting domain-containing protein [bacterium]|nr:T9SS type A sorting domain-containing protein [bacterium]